jgi:hypothetical protein
MIGELICPFCGFSKKVSSQKIPLGAKWATCPRCRQRFEFSISEQGVGFVTEQTWAGFQRGRESHESRHSHKGTPWESPVGLGLWSRIYQTFKAVLFSPEAFFSTLAFKGGIREPLAFGLLAGSMGSMFGVFWQFILLSEGVSFLSEYILSDVALGLIFMIIMISVPIFVTLSMFIYSGILHLFLLIVRGGENGFEATFRVISYSQAAQALGLVPFIGGWIGGVWQLVVQIIGLREIHDTSYFRIITAFLIPVVVFVLLMIATLVPLFLYFNQQWFSQV